MSRAGLYASLVASAALVMSCRGGSGENRSFVSRTPVEITFSCEANPVTVGFADRNGNPAWIVETDGQKKLRWNVAENVTIDSIFAKPGQQLPVEPETPNEGKTHGNPYRSKAKQGVPSGPTRYPYSIALTCEPSGSGQQPVKLIVDPEMIVR